MSEVTDARLIELMATCKACDQFFSEKQRAFYRDVEALIREVQASRAK